MFRLVSISILALLLNLFHYSRTISYTNDQDAFGHTIQIAQTILKSHRSESGISFSDTYCHTWILTTGTLHHYFKRPNTSADKDQNSTFNIDFMAPIITFWSETALKTWQSQGTETEFYTLTASNTSKEYTPEEIMHPLRFGTRKFTRNCASVYLYTNDDNDNNEFQVIQTIELLINIRLVMKHKDYFFVVGSDQEHLQKLMRTQEIAEVRHKISIFIRPEENNFMVDNYCARQIKTKMTGDGPMSMSLFDFDCDTIIQGQHFRAACTNLASMIRPDTKPNTTGGVQKGGGWLYAMFAEGSHRYNYTYETSLATFGGSSGMKRDGIWGGSIGDVLTRKADIAFGVGVTEDRNLLVDPSALQTWLVRVFYVKLPEFRTDWWAILWPLQFNVWMTVIIVISALIPVFVSSAVQYFRMVGLEDGIKSRPTKLGIVFEVFDGLARISMEQAATLRHWKGLRVRSLIIAWTLFCLILGTGYRSKLVSFLTFLDREQIPTTHLELSHSNYKLFFRYYGGVAYRAAAASTNPMHKRILAKSELANSSIDCLYSVLLSETRTACLDFGPNFEYSMNANGTLHAVLHGKEIIVRSKDIDFKAIVVWAYRKYSPMTATFDKLILRSLASGLNEKWQHDDWDMSRMVGATWLRQQYDSPVKKAVEKLLERLGHVGPTSLPVKSLIGLYLIYVFGTIVSIVSILVEILVGKFKIRRSRLRSRSRSRCSRSCARPLN